MLDVIAVEDTKRRMARLMIDTCYVPGTDTKVFEEGDFESLMNMPSGGYYQKLTEAINADSLPKQREEAKKP
jgi:hypothetical protein